MTGQRVSDDPATSFAAERPARDGCPRSPGGRRLKPARDVRRAVRILTASDDASGHAPRAAKGAAEDRTKGDPAARRRRRRVVVVEAVRTIAARRQSNDDAAFAGGQRVFWDVATDGNRPVESSQRFEDRTTSTAPPLSRRRGVGALSTALPSETHDARIALLSAVVRSGSTTTSSGPA